MGVGRISVFRGVEVAIMRKEKMPATIAPESFRAEESFVALLTPVLAWPLEAALGLPTGGLDGSAAHRLAQYRLRGNPIPRHRRVPRPQAAVPERRVHRELGGLRFDWQEFRAWHLHAG